MAHTQNLDSRSDIFTGDDKAREITVGEGG